MKCAMFRWIFVHVMFLYAIQARPPISMHNSEIANECFELEASELELKYPTGTVRIPIFAGRGGKIEDTNLRKYLPKGYEDMSIESMLCSRVKRSFRADTAALVNFYRTQLQLHTTSVTVLCDQKISTRVLIDFKKDGRTGYVEINLGGQCKQLQVFKSYTDAPMRQNSRFVNWRIHLDGESPAALYIKSAKSNSDH